MALKKHIFLILLALCVLTQVRAQLAFDPASWGFGTIPEADGRVSHTFTGVNRGSKPVVILDVVTSCGCTVADFSHQPIVPGGRTQIVVTFDPSNRPGVFNKELSIYSSERQKIATISVRGNVTPRPRSIEELYPVDAGNGLRLTTTLTTFSYIHQGQLVQASVGYANTSKNKITLDLKPEEASSLLRMKYPREIVAGAKGEINFSYLIPLAKPRYGTLRDALEVVVNGRSNGTLLVVHGIGVDAQAKPGAAAPRALFTENTLKFGSIKKAGDIQRLKLTLTNEGDSNLIVRAVESDGHFSTTLTPGRSIPAGGSFTAEVTLDPRKQEFGVLSDHLVIITNDPVRPMRRLRVTAIIED